MNSNDLVLDCLNNDPSIFLKENPLIENVQEIKKDSKSNNKRSKVQTSNKEDKLEIKKQKELIKLQSLQEKTKRKLLQNEVKSLKPGECIKHMLVLMDVHFKEVHFFDKVISVLQESNINHDFVSQPIPFLFTLLRTVSTTVNDESSFNLKTTSKDYLQNNVLMYIPTEDFFLMINSFNLMKEDNHSNNIDIETFIRLCNNTLGSEVNMSIFVVGLQDYIKNVKLKIQKNVNKKSNYFLKGDSVKISFYDIEEIMLQMQLKFGLQAYFLENGDEAAKFLLHFVKAIAEKPFKQLRLNVTDERLGELLKSNQGMKLNAEVDGCTKVWLQQLQQFKSVSIDVANAVADAYPSPIHLIRAYEQCQSISEKEHLLEDINIRRGAGITSTNRKVGSVLSKKIFIFFNSSNENEEIK